MATIKDVAKRAGVSVSTVSNIINHKENVSEEVYKAVTDAMEALHYYPNLFARNLKNNRIKLVAAIVPTLSGIYNDILHGILQVMEASGYHVIIKTTDDLKNKEFKAISQLIGLGVSGIMLVACFCENIKLYDEVLRTRIPLVFIERNIEGRDYAFVVFDNRSLVYKLLHTLIAEQKAAAHDILLLTGHLDYSSERDCVKGALMALEEAYPDATLRCHEISFNKEQAFKELMALLPTLAEHPKYIIISSEQVAESLREVLTLHGWEDIRLYVLMGDQWTSHADRGRFVAIPRRALYCGIQSAEQILKYMENPIIYENAQIVLSTAFPSCQMQTAPRVKSGQAHSNFKLLLLNSPTANAIIRLLPCFRLETGIDVEYTVYDDQVLLYRSILQRTTDKDCSADMFMTDLPWIAHFVRNRVSMPLDELIGPEFAQSFIPAVWKAFQGTYQHIYSVPIMAGPQMLMYRKDLFEDPALQRQYYKTYGIRLETPKTWTEYNFVARYFTKEFHSQSPTEYGNCLFGANPTGLIEEFLPRQWAYNGRIFDKTGVVIDSVQNVRALKNLQEAYRYSVPDIQAYHNNEHVGELANGNVAMVNIFNVHLTSIFDPQFSMVVDKLGYVELPGSQSILGAWGLSIHAKSKKREPALAFLQWFTSPQIAMQATILGSFMPRNDIAQDEQLKVIYPWNAKIRDHLNNTRMRESVVGRYNSLDHTKALDQIIADAIAPVLAEKTNAETALREAKDKIITLIGANR